ncbi:MAG: DUF2975 domain-containing protein [Christensenellales bacterium]|jgi:hypothetical protein
MKQREYVRWLRALVVLAGLALLALVGALVPTLAGEIARSNPELAYLYWPGVLFVWATAAPVYAALAQAWLVCGSIGAGQAFCQRNVGRLKTMGLCMVIDAVLYLLAMVLLIAMNLGHPSILLVILAVVFVGVALAVVFFTLSHLTDKAAALQRDQDLTI